MALNISIKTIDPKEQRYDTLGDWYKDENGNWVILIADMNDWQTEIQYAVHELWEMILCEARGITAAQVDEFDLAFQGEGEPGAEPEAPYHREHVSAMAVEGALGIELRRDVSAGAEAKNSPAEAETGPVEEAGAAPEGSQVRRRRR